MGRTVRSSFPAAAGVAWAGGGVGAGGVGGGGLPWHPSAPASAMASSPCAHMLLGIVMSIPLLEVRF
jgi:hypothetical protein